MDEAALAFRFGLGSIFFLSGLAKIPNLDAFQDVIRAYRVGPRRFARPLARTIPTVETIVGLSLLLGLAVRAAGIAVAILLAVFSVAVTANLLRGRRIACGCFGTVSQREISVFAVLRNAAFIAFAAMVAIQTPTTLSLDEIINGSSVRLSASDGIAMVMVGTVAALALSIAQEAATVFKSRRLFEQRAESAA